MGKGSNRDLYGTRLKQGFVWEQAQTEFVSEIPNNRVCIGNSEQQAMYRNTLTLGLYREWRGMARHARRRAEAPRPWT